MVFCNTIHTNYTIEHKDSHNPYFNRWFSAILEKEMREAYEILVTILILIDGFLQYVNTFNITNKALSQSLF